MRIDQEIFRHMKIPDVHIERVRGLGLSANFLLLLPRLFQVFPLWSPSVTWTLASKGRPSLLRILPPTNRSFGNLTQLPRFLESEALFSIAYDFFRHYLC